MTFSYDLNATKKSVNLSVREDLIVEARASGINLSRVLEETLEIRLRAERAKRWQEDNRGAIDAYNERIERGGLWHKGLTPWY